MDGSRFDDLTRSLVAGVSSRRETLRRLASGAVAAAFGGLGAERAGAQDVGIEAFNLTCRQEDVQFFCARNTPANKVTACGPRNSACVCVQSRDRRSGPKCVEQPASGGCPNRRQKCRRDRDCRRGEICAHVPGCCRNHPKRGLCLQRCPA